MNLLIRHILRSSLTVGFAVLAVWQFTMLDSQQDLIQEQQVLIAELKSYNDSYYESLSNLVPVVQDLHSRLRLAQEEVTISQREVATLEAKLAKYEQSPMIPVRWLTASAPVFTCESRWRVSAATVNQVAGVDYDVIGVPQLLLDPGMIRLIHDLGYTLSQVRNELGPQLHVAYVWSQRTDNGTPFRLWSCRQ